MCSGHDASYAVPRALLDTPLNAMLMCDVFVVPTRTSVFLFFAGISGLRCD